MRLLVAINATDHHNLQDRALRWCGRLGFDLRVFVPKNKRKRFLYCVEDANYHYYLALDPKETIVSRIDVDTYAKLYGYDLILTVPEELLAWRKNTQYSLKEIKLAYETIASGRRKFGQHPRKRIMRFANGSIMRRVS